MCDEVADHIVSLRQRVCPRTSYVTSGLAASIAYCIVDTSLKSRFDTFAEKLRSNDEFDHVECVSNVKDAENLVNGNIVIIFGHESSVLENAIKNLLATRKTKLVVQISLSGTKVVTSKSNTTKKLYSSIISKFGEFEVLSCFNHQSVVMTGTSAKGFNGQPSVQSATQFRYLWSPTTVQVEKGKERVLQRLADKALHGSGSKLPAHTWDNLVRSALSSGMDDYGVYSMIREKVLGSGLAADLEAQVLHGTSSSSHSADPSKQVTEDGEGDGRANHMVSRTLESVPPSLRQSSALRRVLDYGCAEGAITAALGKQLGLAASQVLGADVRAIPSVGFTFVQLPAEAEEPPALGTILPGIEDQSVDLITAAMVFHHVTHVKAALLELRRIISARGALVIREHHCGSADMGAFLDITHGLYSLSWSSPVEWPDFIPEYKAFYRSREEWNALINETGFMLHVEESGLQAVKNYRAAEFATQKPNGYFPNVIKAYYAVYVPNPSFRLPPRQPVNVAAAATVSASAQRNNLTMSSASAGQKRGREGDEGVELESGIEHIRKHKIASSSSSTSTHASSVGVSVSASHGGSGSGEGDKQQLFESSKYPGKFYKINKTTGATEWV